MTDTQKQKKLEQLFEECKKECDAAHIKYSQKITLKITKRATSRYGLCHKNPDGSYIITISDFVFASPDFKIKMVILHEMAHTCKNCMNHGVEWKKIANILNEKYGYTISRTTSREAMELPPKSYKYAVKCKKCGCIIHKQRLTKVIKNPSWYRCGFCGGTFERIK